MAGNNQGVSSFGGLPLIRKALVEIGLFKKISDIFYLKGFLKHGGYQDAQILEAVILLIASGGTCFSDWEILICDPGFKKMFGVCMSVDVLARYLKRLGVTFLETSTEKGQVGYSTLLEIIQHEMILVAYQLAGCPKKLTLDIDTMNDFTHDFIKKIVGFAIYRTHDNLFVYKNSARFFLCLWMKNFSGCVNHRQF